MFSERLKLARKREGLSLRDLADRLSNVVSAQAIGKYERGEMMPGSAAAIALAKALRVTVSYLLSPTDIALEGVEFRKRVSAGVKDRAMVEAAVIDHVDRYLQVEEVLGIASAQWSEPDGAPYEVCTLDEAEVAAEAVRDAWDLGRNPIPDMTEILEEQGIKVLKRQFPSAVDGLSCRVRRADGDVVPVIVCSDEKSIERQRFTLAHELGHLVMAVSDDLDEEKACHRFAGAFLVPGAELVGEVGARRHTLSYPELMEIKQMFGLSAAALVVRMCDLGIITEGTLRRIFQGVGRNWRQKEPAPLERNEPTRRFRRLCFRALAEDAISQSKAAELLGLSVSDIERSMSGPAE
jgi:Zn-dependent peptidase ImmA (M78 family)/DNA-binding XRE family transcriptional regulator